MSFGDFTRLRFSRFRPTLVQRRVAYSQPSLQRDFAITHEGIEAMENTMATAMAPLQEQICRMTPVSAAPETLPEFEALAEQLARIVGVPTVKVRKKSLQPRLVDPAGEEIHLPAPMFHLLARMAEVLSSYRGPAVGMSFDPDQVLAIRELMPLLPRGVTAETTYKEADWPQASPAKRRGMQHLRHAFQTRPHFIAFRVDDLPAAAPWMAQKLFGCALLTWTVRTSEQRERAARYADQMIFEGFVPGT